MVLVLHHSSMSARLRLHFLLPILACFASLIHECNMSVTQTPTATPFAKRSQVLEDLFKHYDKRLPPFFESEKQFTVKVQLFIERINYIDDLNMKFVMTMYVRLFWEEPRLHLNISQLSMDPSLADLIWKPDIFFSNEEDGYTHDQLGKNELMTLFRNGTIFYSRRVTINFDCMMDFHNYPFDEQLCPTEIQSYSFSQDDLKVEWNTPAVQWFRKPKSIRYDIEGYKYGECTTQQWVTGNFSCIYLTVHMRRDRSYYFIQVYLPSGLIVILSWIGFWINYDAVPARLSLAVITVLTISTQTGDVRTQLPPVSYIKALDVWMSMCLIMVFASLIQFAIVNVTYRQTVKLKHRQENILPNLRALQDHYLAKDRCCCPYTASQIDKIARVAFPTIFLIFNIIYWTYYLVVADDKSQGHQMKKFE